jgi:hypothetical protein
MGDITITPIVRPAVSLGPGWRSAVVRDRSPRRLGKPSAGKRSTCINAKISRLVNYLRAVRIPAMEVNFCQLARGIEKP